MKKFLPFSFSLSIFSYRLLSFVATSSWVVLVLGLQAQLAAEAAGIGAVYSEEEV